MQNWFPTLNAALNSEGLLETWPQNKSLQYGECFGYTVDDGSKYGRYVAIYRSDDGRYERPVHYQR